MSSVDVRPYLKEIGRGPNSSRDLPYDDARTLWDAVLDERVDAMALGAVLAAFRYKGESAEELAALVEALQARLPTFTESPRKLVVMPCYNGARKLANLTWLTAQLLARTGYNVLLHGVQHMTGRVTTFEIAEAAGALVARTLADTYALLDRQHIACVPIDVLHPQAARLLSYRQTLGLRNSGHSAVKLMAPAASALRIVPVTHPEYYERSIMWAEQAGINALVFRGHEGEPTPNPKRIGAIAGIVGGDVLYNEPADDDGIELAPSLPEAIDAKSTARWIEDVLRGHRVCPQAVTGFVAHCHALLSGLPQTPRAEPAARSSSSPPDSASALWSVA